jgi:hypothetical protein
MSTFKSDNILKRIFNTYNLTVKNKLITKINNGYLCELFLNSQTTDNTFNPRGKLLYDKKNLKKL